MNWKALEHVPLLLYLLAAKTLLLCLAFAAVKIYQRRRVDAKRQSSGTKREVPAKKDS